LSLPDSVRLYNLANFHPRVIAPDPPEREPQECDIESEFQNVHLDDEEEEEDQPHQPITTFFGKSPESQRWEVLVPDAQGSVQACVLGFGGQLLVTLGKRRVYIWRETLE
jgi:polycomb protein EED